MPGLSGGSGRSMGGGRSVWVGGPGHLEVCVLGEHLVDVLEHFGVRAAALLALRRGELLLHHDPHGFPEGAPRLVEVADLDDISAHLARRGGRAEG